MRICQTAKKQAEPFSNKDLFPIEVLALPNFKRKWMRVLAVVLFPLYFPVMGMVMFVGLLVLFVSLIIMALMMGWDVVAGYINGSGGEE